MLQTIFLLLLTVTVVGANICSRKCYPGNECFPSSQDIEIFRRTLDGDIVFPYNSSYHYLTLMYNVHYTKFPAMIAYVLSTKDIQKSVQFAKKYNLHVTIQSSGHDYIGRSTWHGSFMINLAEMKAMNVDMTSQRHEAGEITVQTGATWVEIYEKVQNYDRVVVGASAHTVSPGGFTQGGGHSPISRYLGLAVDQLLEVEIVTADGSVSNCTAQGCVKISPGGAVDKSSDSDLFWAIRGGGGGTFGVVVSYTFKLHRQPSQVVQASLTYLLSLNGNYSIGRQIFDFYFNFLKTLPKEWGGYLVLQNTQYEFEGGDTAVGTFNLFLNHFGEWSLPSRNAIDEWVNFLSDWRISIKIENKTSFWDYEKDIKGTPWSNVYMVGSFIQKEHLNKSFADFILKKITAPPSSGAPTYGCTMMHIGGKISEISDNLTPIHPGFRSGILCATCSVLFENAARHNFTIEKGKEFYSGLKKFGNGVYINYPVYDLPDWKNQYWGKHYPKLLKIKKKWDPDNFFTCHNCVGSDLSLNNKSTDEKPRKLPINSAGNTAVTLVTILLSVFLVKYIL